MLTVCDSKEGFVSVLGMISSASLIKDYVECLTPNQEEDRILSWIGNTGDTTSSSYVGAFSTDDLARQTVEGCAIHEQTLQEGVSGANEGVLTTLELIYDNDSALANQLRNKLYAKVWFALHKALEMDGYKNQRILAAHIDSEADDVVVLVETVGA